MSVNLNNSGDYVKDLKIFNDGNAGVVENLKVRVEKKARTEADNKKPDYKLIAADDKGEVNEGFYYTADEEKFKKYQGQRLIQLARGVLGKDITFPVWNTPIETLDGVMTMIAPELNKRPYRAAVCYGTTKNPSRFLGFKSFGSFIQPMAEPNTLHLEQIDSVKRAPQPEATSETSLTSKVVGSEDSGLAWLSDSK
jgi:hypothetical protein